MHRTSYASHLRTTLLPLTLAAVAVAAPASAHAAAIGGVTIKSVSSEWNGEPDLRAVNVVNGGGLDSALDPPGHAATYTAGYNMAKIASGVIQTLREEVFRKYLALPAAFFQRESSSVQISGPRRV